MPFGLGGGSSMDSAKAIAVEAAHEGTAWDYLFEKPPRRPFHHCRVHDTRASSTRSAQVAMLTDTATKTEIRHPTRSRLPARLHY